MTTLPTETHPFSRLDPQRVLEALESVGLYGDGRLLALNSYENRVYQVGMEEGPPVVVKFYRPERWSEAAILEEHAFVAELDAQEVPVVPATVLDGRSLHRSKPDLRHAAAVVPRPADPLRGLRPPAPL